MATILIPTRNRPESLIFVLRYFAERYPGTRVFIADGSTGEHREGNRQVVAQVDSELDVELRQYPEELPLLQRIVDALSEAGDEYITMGADDDFLNVDLLRRCEDFLRSAPDYSLAMGYRFDLDYRKRKFTRCTMFHSFSVEMPGVLERMRHFGEWSYATTYSLARRDHLIERYERFRDVPMIFGFMDFIVGMHDVARGKFKVFDELACVSTKNKTHDYMRSGEVLSILHQSQEILKLREMLQADLESYGQMAPEDAKKESKKIIFRRIGELTGHRLPNMLGFADSPHFKDPVVLGQLHTFSKVFTPGTAEHERNWAPIWAAHEMVRAMVAPGAPTPAPPSQVEAPQAGGKEPAGGGKLGFVRSLLKMSTPSKTDRSGPSPAMDDLVIPEKGFQFYKFLDPVTLREKE